VQISDTVLYGEESVKKSRISFEKNGNTRALWNFDDGEGATEFYDESGFNNLLLGHNGAHTKGPIIVSLDNMEFNISQSYMLFQNYPNPFNPTTTIEYRLPRANKVRLTIFNILGEEIATLVNQLQPAGFYQVQWDGTDHFGNQLSSGVYIYRITAGRFTQSNKMILIR
jgi:hypothetical protein